MSLFYWRKIKTNKACISTDSLQLNQNCYFFLKAFCFCLPGWILPWLVALCPSSHAGCPAAGHRESWGWAQSSPGIPANVCQPHGHGGRWALLFCCSGCAKLVLDQQQPPPRCPHWANPLLEAEVAAVPMASLQLRPPQGNGFRISRSQRQVDQLQAKSRQKSPPRPLCSSAAGDFRVFNYQNLHQFRSFLSPVHRLSQAKRPMESVCLQQLNLNEGMLHLLH